jgi:hypothetical protein
MIWRFSLRRASVQLRVRLGHGFNSWIRCINLLLDHHVHLLKLETDEGRPSAVGPISVQMTLRHPGRKRLQTLISALNRSTYGCFEEGPP